MQVVNSRFIAPRSFRIPACQVLTLGAVRRHESCRPPRQESCCRGPVQFSYRPGTAELEQSRAGRLFSGGPASLLLGRRRTSGDEISFAESAYRCRCPRYGKFGMNALMTNLPERTNLPHLRVCRSAYSRLNLASRYHGSAVSSFSTRRATISPSAGPCLNPWPEPPPTIHTFTFPGCRSTMKLWSVALSDWQTRGSTSGASFIPGKSEAR